MSASPTLNDYQLAELRKFMVKHAENEELAASFDSGVGPVHKLSWYACKVPGTVAVTTENGFVLRLLFPTPGPRNHDPLFQYASPLVRWWSVFNVLKSNIAYLRDWQWSFSGMDAPDEIPGGACEWFAASEEAYGAVQITVQREGAIE
jgi:hypothetical protein